MTRYVGHKEKANKSLVRFIESLNAGNTYLQTIYVHTFTDYSGNQFIFIDFYGTVPCRLDIFTQ